MNKILPQRDLDKLKKIRARVIGIEEIGFIDGVSGYLSDEKNIIKMLQCDHKYNDVIDKLRDYLMGYNIGKYFFEMTDDKSSIFIDTAGDLRDVSYSPMKEFNPATQMYKTLKRKDEACADEFDSEEIFYNLGRADALILKQNNSEYLAIILSHSKMYGDAVKDVWQYLKGFYYQMEITYSSDEEEVAVEFPPLCFLGDAHHILERACK